MPRGDLELIISPNYKRAFTRLFVASIKSSGNAFRFIASDNYRLLYCLKNSPEKQESWKQGKVQENKETRNKFHIPSTGKEKKFVERREGELVAVAG